MAMPELTKEQKAALVVSRMARMVAHREAAHAPKKLRFEGNIRRKANPKGPQDMLCICQWGLVSFVDNGILAVDNRM